MYHYKPEDGYFGDPIPFFWNGVYHLFYLKAPLEPKRHGADFSCYEHISTTDFLQWKEHPVVIEPKDNSPDAMGCWTGSIIEKDGLFYLFYTGHNGRHPTEPQTVCVATSRDLDHWEKGERNPILLPNPRIYNIKHWRDPFVFWSEEEHCYLMSLTTVLKKGCHWKGGALVVCRSNDLIAWKPGEVFYYPGNHGFPECSDIFKIGNYWYLVCSIFDKTCYRVGDSPLGPWRAARTESFDGVLNYAAKTISDGENRYAIGWIRTKSQLKDGGAWEWGGHMSFPRQLVQDSDGTLYSKLPEHFQILKGPLADDSAPEMHGEVLFGKWSGTGVPIQTVGDQLYGEIAFPGEYSAFDGTFEFTLGPGTHCAGIIIQADPDANHPGYEIALDRKHNLLLFRKHGKRFGCYTSQDLLLEPGESIHLRVIVEPRLIEIFVNDRYALCSSFYHYRESSKIHFFVEEGSANLERVHLHKLADEENSRNSEAAKNRCLSSSLTSI